MRLRRNSRAQRAFGALKRLTECTRSLRAGLLCSSVQRSVVGPNGTEGVSGASYLTRAVPFQSSSGCASCAGSAAFSRCSVARQPKGGLLRLQTRDVSQVRGVAEGRQTRSRVSFQQPRCSMREADDHRKETYTKCRKVQFLVQRSPWNIMKLGRLGEVQTEYHLPYQRALPLPIFKPVDLSGNTERVPTPKELRRMMEFERALSHPGDGLCQDKKMISEITNDLPPVMHMPLTEFGKSAPTTFPLKNFVPGGQTGLRDRLDR
ncbi:hypothetical protein NDU88_001707 [Pleurodeles waltl]|uniref:Uncharacterized protein n=1 Tax=Pleurodeles waltl TaxID=8319 RepID=A0AAV7Q6R8_PLEWA|nr:hypothetical protein NDU88_001707 [Pleurodeles waltl]